MKDFTPISLVAAGPLVVSTAPNVPANNLKEFFDLVRKDPDKYTPSPPPALAPLAICYRALEAPGRCQHAGHHLQRRGSHAQRSHGRQIHLVADPMLSSLPLAQNKSIKALAITSLERRPHAPKFRRSGNPACTSSSSSRGTGCGVRRVCRRYRHETANERRQSLGALPDVKARLTALGFEAIGSTAGLFRQIHHERNGEIREDHSRRQHEGRVKRRVLAGARQEEAMTMRIAPVALAAVIWICGKRKRTTAGATDHTTATRFLEDRNQDHRSRRQHLHAAG